VGTFVVTYGAPFGTTGPIRLKLALIVVMVRLPIKFGYLACSIVYKEKNAILLNAKEVTSRRFVIAPAQKFKSRAAIACHIRHPHEYSVLFVFTRTESLT